MLDEGYANETFGVGTDEEVRYTVWYYYPADYDSYPERISISYVEGVVEIVIDGI